MRARVRDPRLKEILVPDVQPHGFECKRISSTPIVEVTKHGIKTTEKEWEFDYVVCATGFGAVTGGCCKSTYTAREANALQTSGRLAQGHTWEWQSLVSPTCSSHMGRKRLLRCATGQLVQSIRATLLSI